MEREEKKMNFSELAKARFSVRKYQSKEIEQEKLDQILEAGRVAPTACNFQPQKIYVVRSEEGRARLAEVCKFTFDAPIVMVVAFDTERDWKNKRMPGYSSGETDAAIVCTHMMLQAWELGIGSCWVGCFASDRVKEALDLPQNLRVTALMPMGYPADDAEPMEFHTIYRELEDTVQIL